MHAGVSADADDGAVAEMDLTCAAHEKVEAEGRRRPDDPWQQIADEIKPVEQERRGEQQGDNQQDEPPVERHGPELALVLVAGMTDACAAIEHQILSICSRPKRPCGRARRVTRMITDATMSRVPPPTTGSSTPVAMLSASPTMTPAISTPGIESRPPRMAMA